MIEEPYFDFRGETDLDHWLGAVPFEVTIRRVLESEYQKHQ